MERTGSNFRRGSPPRHDFARMAVAEREGAEGAKARLLARRASLVLQALAILFFTMTREPYVAFFSILLILSKGLLLLCPWPVLRGSIAENPAYRGVLRLRGRGLRPARGERESLPQRRGGRRRDRDFLGRGGALARRADLGRPFSVIRGASFVFFAIREYAGRHGSKPHEGRPGGPAD